MARTKIEHLTIDERVAHGVRAREETPPSAHEGWTPAADRDPVRLLSEQDATREPDLVPVRHGRMMVSPFTFYRGGAKIMAADLAGTPTAGLDVQLCGDAHLSNFGLFASPERILLFDLNDFDETLPGPFEYDVERMAASFVVAARNNGFDPAQAADAARASVRAYREAMQSFAQMRTLDIWYAYLDENELLRALRAAAAEHVKAEDAAKAAKKAKTKKGQKGRKRQKASEAEAAKNEAKQAKRVDRMERIAAKTGAKARTRDSLQALSKLAERVNGTYRIVSQPPIIVPVRELGTAYGMSGDEVENVVRGQLRSYRTTLPDDRRRLLERFEVVDVARKVVGVGSVGTRAFIALLQGRDADDPLFLQVKEATTSVLEDHLPKSRFRQHGERVVQGQRMMQASSDIFLGWTKGADAERHFYWRQLRDMKGSVDVESTRPEGMVFYAEMCGWTLARAHARSGDPIAIATYLGHDDTFDRSMTDFAVRYADQNELDYLEFTAQVASGALEALTGV
jgi:uncharacterized protein (DUF2252 family)